MTDLRPFEVTPARDSPDRIARADLIVPTPPVLPPATDMPSAKLRGEMLGAYVLELLPFAHGLVAKITARQAVEDALVTRDRRRRAAQEHELAKISVRPKS